LAGRPGAGLVLRGGEADRSRGADLPGCHRRSEVGWLGLGDLAGPDLGPARRSR
jgi:hypothetical protein